MSNASKAFQDEITADLFAGFPVSDFQIALTWYNKLLGCHPAFFPNEEEAVWELIEHRYFFIKVNPEWAGHAYNLVFLSNFDSFIEKVADRGIQPAVSETLQNGVRKIIYNDPDGNEIGFGGMPTTES